MGAIDAAARQWASELENREKARSGVPLTIARQTVARRLSVAPGTLEGLRRGRGKGARAWLVERLQSAFVRELELEIARLTHERQMALQIGMDTREDQVREIEAHLAAARGLIEQRA